MNLLFFYVNIIILSLMLLLFLLGNNLEIIGIYVMEMLSICKFLFYVLKNLVEELKINLVLNYIL